MPDAEEARAATGYERYTITPFGSIRPWPVIVDASVLDQPIVSVGGGAFGVNLHMAPNDLVAALGADVVDVSVPERVALDCADGDRPRGRTVFRRAFAAGSSCGTIADEATPSAAAPYRGRSPVRIPDDPPRRWHVRRMVGQLDRRFFLSLAQGIIGFVPRRRRC